jgi:hypothetical protein
MKLKFYKYSFGIQFKYSYLVGAKIFAVFVILNFDAYFGINFM